MYESYKDQGLTVITLLGENDYGQPPSQSEVMGWVNQYGITHPVVVDGDQNGDGYAFDETANYLFASANFNGSFALPNMQLLSQGRVVVYSNTYVTQNQILSALP